MERELLVQQQAGWLEERIWQSTVGRARAVAAVVAARLHAHGLTPAEVFGLVSDEGLVLAVQKDLFAGEAFEELLGRRYRKLLLRWAYRWGLAYADADDLAATLSLKFWRKRFRSYRIGAEDGYNFRAYLWTAARHQWVQELRKRRPGPWPEGLESADHGPSPEEVLWGRELEEQLGAALAGLSEPDGEIMRATLAGRTLPEIAGDLGLTYSAAAQGRFRARNALEQQLRLPARGRGGT